LVPPIPWLPKARLVGFSVTAGAVAIPVPVRAIACGLSAALSVRVTPAVLEPAAWGEKVTLIVQDALAANEAGQLLVWAKSALLVPVRTMLLIVRAAVPELVSVTV